MKKRFISMLLVLCMVFTLFPSAAFAQDDTGIAPPIAIGTSGVEDGTPLCENHKAHTADCGYAEAVEGAVCTHECELCKDVAPALLSAPRAATTGYRYDPDSKTLTIDANEGTTAWKDNNITISNVSKVVIESGVTAIGDYAFSGCTSLASVTIPSGVTAIGIGAFSSCAKLDSVTFADGSELATIGNDAFYECKSLTGIIIPSGVTDIGDAAFYECSSLESVTIPSSVADIYSRAFYGCSSLKSVTFEGLAPPSFGENVFDNTHDDLKIYVPKDSVDNYKAVSKLAAYEGKIVAKSEPTTGYNYDPDSKTLTIDSNEGTTAWRRDSSISDVTKVVIESGVTNIGYDAFSSCASLDSVTIPSGVTTIGKYAFYNCIRLDGVTIPSGVTTIDNYAFSGCRSLTSVTIPSSVTNIGNSALYGCGSLESVTFAEDSELETIGSEAFYECAKLASVDIPESVTTIGGQAFYGCRSLTSITIPEGVTRIGGSAFNQCRRLAKVIFERATPPTIERDVFYNTNIGLKIYVPKNSVQQYKNVPSLSSYANSIVAKNEPIAGVGYSYDPNSKTLTIDADTGTTAWRSNSNITKEYVTKVEIKEGVTAIGNQAFQHCTDLTDVTFAPDSKLTTIGVDAFKGCTDLTGVTIPEGVTTIGANAFDDCAILASVTFAPDSKLTTIGANAFKGCIGLTGVTIPEGVTTIGANAFQICTSLTDVTFAPDSKLTTIGAAAFSGCIYLTGVTIPEGVTTIGANAFDSCKKLADVTFAPDSKLTTIGADAFARCTVLTDMTIPEGVTDIGANAFDGCKKLADVTFAPDSKLTTIGADAFKGCIGLTGVTIPEGVTDIGAGAFKGCASLASVTFEGATPPTTFGTDVFTSTASGLKIYVPTAAAVAEYKNVANLADYASKIEAVGGVTSTKITNSLDFTKTSADGGMSDKTSCVDGSGHTAHTGNPCWAWNTTTSTLTLNNVDIEVSGDALTGTGIVLPRVATTILFSGSNTVKADELGVYCENPLTLTGESNSASLTISANNQPGIILGNSLTVTEGIVNVTSKENCAIAFVNSVYSINLSGGTVTAKGGNGKSPFDAEPTLSNGMVHKDGTGTWDNTAGTACTYEKSAAATVTEVAVSPKATSVQKGTTQQFSAAVTGTNNPAQTVTWAVTGGTKSGTTINASGMLAVAADETATSLTVTATSTVDTAKSDTAAVTVTTTPVTKYALTVTGGTGSGSFEENATVTITANAPATGKVFDKWTTTDGVTFTDANAATTTITMPAKAVTVTAIYRNESVNVPVTAITLNKSTISLYSNTNPSSETLTATVTPANATNKAVTWSSSNPTVATVVNGTVTAVANGTATITATTADGGKTASCIVTVSAYTGGTTTGGNDSDNSSSSGGSAGGVTTPGKTVIDNSVGNQGSTNVLTEAVNNALATGKTNPTVYTNFANYTALIKDGIKAINDAAAAAAKGKIVTLITKVQLDSKVGNTVVSRITVDPAKLSAVMPEKLGLGIWFDQKKDAQVTVVRNKFEKAFDNSLVVVTFEQKTPMGVSMEFAAKPDMTGLNTKALYFYSYNPETNHYDRILSPGYWVDTKGYTHFTAPFGGSVVITDRPLTKK